MKKATLLTTILIGLCALGLCVVGCPTDVDSSDPKPKVTGITVSPSTVNVNQGGERAFTAAVTGTGKYPQTVSWSIVETDKKAGTTITVGGTLTVAADETAGRTLTIRANSTLAGYTDVHGQAIVTVLDANAITVSSVTVEPSTANVNQGHEREFTAVVEGTGSFPQTVTWSIVETDKKDGTTIDADGKLTVAADEIIDKTLTIQANSTLTGYTNIFGQAIVTVKDANAPTVDSVTVTPPTANVEPGGTETFTATVAGTGSFPQTVTWSIVETSKKPGTTITAGVLTVAADEPAGTLTIRANSTLEGYTDVHGQAIVTVIGTTPPPAKIWLVGDITNWLDGPKQPIALTAENNGTFTWTGTLTTGYLKFSGDNDSPADYTGVWLTPPANSAAAVDCATLNTPQSLPFETGANKEYGSWQIVNSGVYTITVNPASSTVIFARTDDLALAITDIWLASTLANNWNPPFTDQWKFTEKLDGTFIWTGTFTSATTYFRFYTMSSDGGNYFMPTVNDTVVSAKDTATPMSVAPTTSNSWRWTTAEEISIVIDPAAQTFVITDSEPVVTQIILTPSTANVEQGKTREFTATVHGQGSYPHTVTWSIVEADKKTGTDIDTDGELTVALDETVNKTLTIRAHSTLAGYTHVLGEAIVTVIAPVTTPTVDNVTILVEGVEPEGQIEVERGYTQQFTVEVEAFGGASDAVTWSIVETTTAAGTAISPSGLLTINIAEEMAVLTIKAASVQDSSQSDTVTVKVCRTEIWFASGSVGSTMNSQWYGPDNPPATRIFTQNTDGTYEKTITSNNANNFYFRFYVKSTKTGATGVYYKPDQSNPPPVYNASVQMPVPTSESARTWEYSYNGTFKITIDTTTHTFIFSVPSTFTAINVNPATINVSQGGQQQFSVTVIDNYSPQAVSWSIDGADDGTTTAAGSTITPTGLLTVSETEPTGTDLTIRATSTAEGYTNITGTATVSITAAGSFVPSGFEVWLLGPGTPGGNSFDAAGNKMTDLGGGIFEWIGQLNAGGVQFPSNKGGVTPGWGAGTFYGWQTGGATAVTFGEEQYVQTYTGNSNGFTIGNADAGNYTITLNTNSTAQIPDKTPPAQMGGTVKFVKN